MQKVHDLTVAAPLIKTFTHVTINSLSLSYMFNSVSPTKTIKNDLITPTETSANSTTKSQPNSGERKSCSNKKGRNLLPSPDSPT